MASITRGCLMAEAGNGGAARAIDNPAAILGNQPTTALGQPTALGGVRAGFDAARGCWLTPMMLNLSRKHIATLPQGGVRSPRGAALRPRRPARM